MGKPSPIRYSILDTRYSILDTRFIFLVGLGLAAWLVFSSEEASVTPGVGQVFIFSLVLSLSPLLSRSRWYLHAPRRILRIYFNRAPYSSPPSHTAPMSLPESSEHPIGLERPKAVSLPYPTAVASGPRSFPSGQAPHLALTAASHGGQGVGCRRWLPGWSDTGRYSFTYGTGLFMWTCAGSCCSIRPVGYALL